MTYFKAIYAFVVFAVLGSSAGQHYEGLAQPATNALLPLLDIPANPLPVIPEASQLSTLTPFHTRKTQLASRTILPGNILPNLALNVDICLDLTVNVLGTRVLNLAAVLSLGARIGQNGISVNQLALVQAALLSQLTATARTSTTSYACRTACPSNTCQSYSFDPATHACTLVPVELLATSNVIARIIGDLSLQGSSSSEYCGLCPSRCASTPSPVGRHRRRNRSEVSLCPENLDACPIKKDSFSQGYECIDTREELGSCGGCSTTNEGIDCTQVAGVATAGCRDGHCVAYECESGYELTSDETCV